MPNRRATRASVETAASRAHALAHNLLARAPGKRPRRIVVDLTGSYPARTPSSPLFRLPLPPELRLTHSSLGELERQVAALAAAPWLESVVFRLEGLHVGHVTAQALRRLIAELESAGKKTLAYVTHLDWTSYYVASAAGTVVAPESAELGLFRPAFSTLFLRGALERVGVRFEKLAIGEYKSAFDELTRDGMSAAQREQLGALIDSLEQQFVADVVEARGVSPQVVREALDEGLTSAAELMRLGFIDRVAYEDELLGEETQPHDQAKRFLRMRAPEGRDRIAVVSIEGAIVTGKSRRSPLPIPMLRVLSGSETVIRCLRAAARDPRTAAIVLYVDSGGGSALASDLIGREVTRIARTKPVVAVMGSVAASGGYYVLAGATHVMAAAGTVTGSIGVLTGKLSLEKLYERLGVVAEHVARGRLSLMRSPARAFTEEERALLERQNRDIYERFVARVAEGRKMPAALIDELGRGRIWSGSDALRHGLVDELGDVNTAITRAAELAKLPAGAPTWDVAAPRQLLLPTSEDPTTLARVAEAFGGEHLLLCDVLL
jgi:protease-4